MSIKPIHHYSMENIPSIFDEEAMTALQLSGRLAAKVNEIISAFNKLDAETTAANNTQDDRLGVLENFDTWTRDTLQALFDQIAELVVTPLGYATPAMFGALGDGVHDDTLAIQAALNALNYNVHTIIIPGGDYKVTADLIVPRGAVITGAGEYATTIRRAANNLTNYGVFKLNNVDDVEISKLSIYGDKDTHTGTSGEWGAGIEIKSCSNVYIHDVGVYKCWGDGIYVGRIENTSSNITVERCNIGSNRRNGVSVIACDGFRLIDSKIHHTSGTAPEAGIDFEPNTLGEKISGAYIRGCQFYDNNQKDVLIYDGKNLPYNHIMFTDCEFKSKVGFDYYSTDLLTSATTADNYGRVVIENSTFDNSSRCVILTKAYKDTFVHFKGCRFNCNTICVELGGTGAKSEGGIMGGVNFTNCVVTGNGNHPVFRAINPDGGLDAITGELFIINTSSYAYAYTTCNSDFSKTVQLRIANKPRIFLGSVMFTLDHYNLYSELIYETSATACEIQLSDTFPLNFPVRLINKGASVKVKLDNSNYWTIANGGEATIEKTNTCWAVTGAGVTFSSIS